LARRAGLGAFGGCVMKEECSFLMKRTKTLVLITGNIRGSGLRRLRAATDKSFLLLFFKKEGLSS
jgi:hypothetical protein